MRSQLDETFETLECSVDVRNKFWNLMKTPLQDLSDSDLEWASKQDHLNSYMSKKVFLLEIERRNSKKREMI